MEVNNTLLIQFGYTTRPAGNITDIKEYSFTLPISFKKLLSTVGCTSTANGVIGIAMTESTNSVIKWSIKPNHTNTTNTILYFVIFGY